MGSSPARTTIPSTGARGLATMLAVASAFLLSACVSVADDDVKRGREIAAEIDALRPAWVREVRYEPGDAMDPAVVVIELAPAATIEMVDAFVCTVVRSSLAQHAASPELGVQFWRGGEFVRHGSEVPCPSGLGAQGLRPPARDRSHWATTSGVGHRDN